MEGAKHPLRSEQLGPIGDAADARVRVCEIRAGAERPHESWKQAVERVEQPGHARWRGTLAERLGGVWAPIFCLHPLELTLLSRVLGRARPAPRMGANSIQVPAPG